MRLRDDQPRTHHYQFAHRILPTLMLRPTIDLVALAGAGRLDVALAGTWRDFGAGLPEADRLPPDGLSGRLARAGDTDVLLITLPPTLYITEAHFVAVAPAAPASARRFLTLERSWSLTGEPVTVLGEWTDRAHVNHGSGPQPSAGAFLAAVERLLGRAS
jgi:hypothetical protein